MPGTALEEAGAPLGAQRPHIHQVKGGAVSVCLCFQCMKVRDALLGKRALEQDGSPKYCLCCDACCVKRKLFADRLPGACHPVLSILAFSEAISLIESQTGFSWWCWGAVQNS